MGVFAPLVGIIGAVQAAEAINLLSGAGETLVGQLLTLDTRHMGFFAVRMPRNTDCATCAASR
jgi:molybdopterin/thiamine biosynthesis adenylyltransferase